jgi:hypothetical protein
VHDNELLPSRRACAAEDLRQRRRWHRRQSFREPEQATPPEEAMPKTDNTFIDAIKGM